MGLTSTITTNETEITSEIIPNEKTTNFFEKNIIIPIFGEFQTKIIWSNAIGIIGIHLLAVYAMITYDWTSGIKLVPWCFFVGYLSGFGVTAGAHRLWSHQSYKAKLPLRILLMICFTMSGQNSLFAWVRDHRVHHRFTETDADPHDARRGFFFSHVGWLMMKKHPEVIKRGKEVDFSDLFKDPVVIFHLKYFSILKTLFAFVLPTLVPPLLWNEDWYSSFVGIIIVRYVVSLNFVWLVNSAAHLWGYQPYDKRYQARENLAVSIVAIGEGWHNYHHAFPWDYKAAELGHYFNVTTFWLELFAKIGWAYDLRTPTERHLQKIITTYGDGSHFKWGYESEKHKNNISLNDVSNTK